MTIAELFLSEYDLSKYNCAHFACDVFLALTGRDVSAHIGMFMHSAPAQGRHSFRRLRTPSRTCIALMHTTWGATHVGVWHAGRIMHLSPAGPANLPESSVAPGYRGVRYYACV